MSGSREIGPHNFLKYLRRQDEEALVYVAREYGGLIRAVISRQLSQNAWLESPESYLEECMNDVLLAVWQYADCYDPSQSSFENWLAGVSRHKAMDCIRRRLRRPQVSPLEELPLSAEPFSEDTTELDMDAILRPLTPQDRKLFIERYLEGRTVEEISSRMGIKTEAVYNRLSRGRRRIQKEFGITRRNM